MKHEQQKKWQQVGSAKDMVDRHITRLVNEQKQVFIQGLENGSSYFVYVPPKTNEEPQALNASVGYTMRDYFIERNGKRFIKIKRFSKTRRYYTTKWIKTSARILNDKWVYNLKG